MSYAWIHENPAYWDENKERIIGNAPKGIFDLGNYAPGAVLPGDWWRVQDDDRVVGYGWMDVVWGDAEVLLAVDPDVQKKGVGSFILERLAEEARARGLNYMVNVVKDSHPDRIRVTEWLKKRGFQEDPRGALRRRVREEDLGGTDS